MRVILLILVLTTSCLAGTTRMYDLTTGAMTVLKYSGLSKGKLSGALPSGEKLTGEFVTVTKATVGWGSIFSAVCGIGSSTTSTSTSIGEQFGSAVLLGDKGTMIDCEYTVGVWAHGTGACTDNRGGKYRLLF